MDPFCAGLFSVGRGGGGLRKIYEWKWMAGAGAAGGAVVFKWSVEHGSSIIHGLETSSAAPLTSIPPLEPLQSV